MDLKPPSSSGLGSMHTSERRAVGVGTHQYGQIILPIGCDGSGRWGPGQGDGRVPCNACRPIASALPLHGVSTSRVLEQSWNAARLKAVDSGVSRVALLGASAALGTPWRQRVERRRGPCRDLIPSIADHCILTMAVFAIFTTTAWSCGGP
jgi:hypothetical protein